MTPQQRQLYFMQQDAIETFYTFHPEAFEYLTEEELELLDRYYFVRRDIDVDNIADYATNLYEVDPTIQKRAEVVLQKVIAGFGLDEQRMSELLSET